MNLTTHKGEDNRPKNWNARRVAIEFANDGQRDRLLSISLGKAHHIKKSGAPGR
jgi:hypothetical protein